MGEECDYWVGNTCRVTVSEEVGKDGIKSIGFKDSLGLGKAQASLSVRRIRKRWWKKQHREKKQRCLVEAQHPEDLQ